MRYEAMIKNKPKTPKVIEPQAFFTLPGSPPEVTKLKPPKTRIKNKTIPAKGMKAFNKLEKISSAKLNGTGVPIYPYYNKEAYLPI